MHLIDIREVGKWYHHVHVLDACTTHVDRGEVVVVCGPSGSGKSTLIQCVNGLEAFQRGGIRVDGVDVGARGTDLSTLRRRVGMVFQHFELFPHLTVMDNLTLAPRKVLGRTRAEAEGRAEHYLQRVGLSRLARRYPGQLSGGQQQRVAIARALCMDPVAMLFDEPTSALDPEMVSEVLDVMIGLADEGMTMMVVTHEMDFARGIADRVVFMDAGRIVEDVPSAEFFGNAQDRAPRARQFLQHVLNRGSATRQRGGAAATISASSPSVIPALCQPPPPSPS